jgi:twitching motility protein PilT
MPRIDAFLQLGREQGASDVHFTEGLPPLIRLDGELTPIKYRNLTEVEINSILTEILGDRKRRDLEDGGAVDLSYSNETVGRFRVNVFQQARGLSAVCRVIPDTVIPLSELGLPALVNQVTNLNAGLVLVTGATGSGKSTTLAAIIDQINEKREANIITLEDPVEFLHRSKKSLVVQRELGVHVNSFRDGLRAALREDPDVILVGELRDPETITLAMEASETGHLVLATLHTRGAAQTIDRILDSFPEEAHNQVRHTLADNLKYVICQELVRASDGRGRRAATEILMVVPAVQQLIRDGRTFQISGAISTGRRFGMHLMDHSLMNLVRAGDIDPDHAFILARDKADFAPHVSDPALAGGIDLRQRADDL